MEQSPSLEADGLLIVKEISCPIGVMECKGSLQCSEDLAQKPEQTVTACIFRL